MRYVFWKSYVRNPLVFRPIAMLLLSRKRYPLAFVLGETLLSLIKHHLTVLCSKSTSRSPHACGETLLSLVCSKSTSLSPHCYAFASGENMATSRAEYLIMTFWFAEVLVWLAARNHLLLKCSDCAVSVNRLHVRLMGSLLYLREGDWWCRLFLFCFLFVSGDVLTQRGDRTTLSTVYNWICCHWNEFLDMYQGK